MKKSNIIYSLTVEDIQTVANQELGKDLTLDEVVKIKEVIGEKIKWYEAISDSISEMLRLK
ncbi:MAG: hypothetical protein Q7U71_06705 [bacterium]|nr:hypothetical protein [bacterium]